VALGVHLSRWLSLIPGWAGVTALRPDSRGRANGGSTEPPYFLPARESVLKVSSSRPFGTAPVLAHQNCWYFVTEPAYWVALVK
jgi:hypothetical protein